MFNIKNTLTATLLFLASVVTAQVDTLEWFALDRYFPANIPLAVDIKTRNFNDIYSFQYGVKYDTSALKLDSVTFYNVLPGYDLSGFGFEWAPAPFHIKAGNMTTIWTDAYGYTLPKGTQVYNMHFTTKKAGQLINHLWPSTEELVFEAITEDGKEIPTTFSVITEGGAAVIEPNALQVIYPNPASNYINVAEFSKIYDLSGNLVASGNGLINFNLTPGLYLVVTSTGMTKLIIK